MRRSTVLTSLLLATCVGLPVTAAYLGRPTASASEIQVAPPAAGYVVHVLTAAEATADVKLMRQALETVHPGLYRRTSKAEMDAAFAELEAAASAPITELELYRRISLTLAKIRCNHTKAEMPEALAKWRAENPSHLPFRFKILEGRMIVASSDPAQTALPRGTEILTINGRPVSELIETLGAYVPIDGDTVWARATSLSSDSDLMGSDFDTFYPFVFGFADTFAMTFKTGDDAPVEEVTLKPVSFNDWKKLPNDGRAYRENFGTDTSWKLLADKTAILSIPTFVNYREPVDPIAFYDGIFKEIEAAGALRVIVDLRENGGGSSDATYALADFLLQRAFVWNKALRLKAIRYGELPKYISSWGDPKELFEPAVDGFIQATDGFYDIIPVNSPDELLPRVPAAAAFGGPVTILTSPVNGSGSTMLIAKLKDEGRVRLVGGRSGGSGDGPTCGSIFFVTLPNSGIAIRVSQAFNQMQVSSFEPEGGVTPDVLVEQSVADFRTGRDTVLEAALADGTHQSAKTALPDESSLIGRFAGSWAGTLEYRDFGNDRRVTLQTSIDAAVSPDGQNVTLAYTYDDGPGKTVRESSTISIDGAEEILSKTTADGADLYRISGDLHAADGAPVTLTLWGRGTENDQAVDVRETLTLSSTNLTLLRETRVKGGAFQFRHEYRMQRLAN